jgi:protein-S-isoprenylcysteine O-methyltransferase Ste14
MTTSEQALPRARFDMDATAELLARATVGTLFTLLALNIFAEFQRTGHLTGLLLLGSESLVVVFTVLRRRPSVVDRSATTRLVTAISLAGPPLLRASAGAPLVPDAATAIASGVGLLVVIVAKVTLGRSFGIVPANRGLVMRGLYTMVRHPIYTGYLITHLAFLVAHPSAWNLLIAVMADTALVVRALLEERLLRQDDRYRAYCRHVHWHFVPGLF